MIKYCDDAPAKKFLPIDIKLKYDNRDKFEIAIQSNKLIIKPFNEHAYSIKKSNNDDRAYPYNLITEFKIKKKTVLKPVIALMFAVKDKYYHNISTWLQSDAIACWLYDCEQLLIEKGGDPKLKLPNLQFKPQILKLNSTRNNSQQQEHPYYNVIEQKSSVFELDEEPSIEMTRGNIKDEEEGIDGEMVMAENDFSDDSGGEDDEEEEDEMGKGMNEVINNAY